MYRYNSDVGTSIQYKIRNHNTSPTTPHASWMAHNLHKLGGLCDDKRQGCWKVLHDCATIYYIYLYIAMRTLYILYYYYRH